MIKVIRSLILLGVAYWTMLPTQAAVPAGSPYLTQTPQFFMNDELQDSLSFTSFLLCFMGQIGADKMASATSTTYLALVDEPSCSSDSQVAQGAQDTSKAGAAASKGGSSNISYSNITVTVSQDSATDPMQVKAWYHLPGEDEDPDSLVYILGTTTDPVSDANPYGKFTFQYTVVIPAEGNAIIQKGIMTATGPQILWNDTFLIDPDNDIWAAGKAVINLGANNTGNGVVEWSDDDGFYQSAYAYSSETFCRDHLKEFNSDTNSWDDISQAEQCFFTAESKGKKEVFSYSLYNSLTGDQHDLSNKGFGISFTDSGVQKFGFADFFGTHFDEETSVGLADNQAFTVTDPSSDRNGDTVNLDIKYGKLIKITQSKVSLDSLNGIRLNTFLPSSSAIGTNANGAGEYTLYWDATNARFTATHKDRKAITNFNFTAANYTGASGDDNLDAFGAWVPGMGELTVEESAMSSPASNLIPLRTNELVASSDYPSTLYCLEMCPSYETIAATYAAIIDDDTDTSPTDAYQGTRRWSADANELVTYTLNSSTGHYQTSGGDIVLRASDSSEYALFENQDHSGNYIHGVNTGPLVTTASELECPNDINSDVDYCMFNANVGNISSYYVWETGHKSWRQKRTLLDSSGNTIAFSPPQTLYFTAPNNSDQYGEFAGKEIALDFNGGSNLWGIPGKCLNTTTGIFIDNCYKNGSNGSGGFWPWVDYFKLPKNEATGRLYTGRSQTGDYYLTAPNEGAVFLGPDSGSVGDLTLGDLSELSDLPSIPNIGPSGGANYIGAEPTTPSSPSIRVGERIGD